MVFPSRLYFFHSRTNITYINPSHTQTLYFFPIYGIRISKQHSKLTCIHDNTITKLIPLHYSDRVASATPVRFLHLRFLFLFFWRGGGGGGGGGCIYTGNLIYHLCPLAYVAIFSGQLSFCRIYFFALLQSDCVDAAVLWSRYFFRAATSFELLLFENSQSFQQLFFQKQLIFWWKNCLE